MSSASTFIGPYEHELNVLGWLTGAQTCVVGTPLPSTLGNTIYVDHIDHFAGSTGEYPPTGYTSADVSDVYGITLSHEGLHTPPRVTIYSNLEIGGGPFSSEVEKYVGELITAHAPAPEQPVLVSVVYRSVPTLRILSLRLEEAYGDDITVVWGFAQLSPAVLYATIQRSLEAGRVTVLLCDADSWGGYRHLVAAMARMWKFSAAPVVAFEIKRPITSVVIETNYVKAHTITHAGFRFPTYTTGRMESIDTPSDIHIGFTLIDQVYSRNRTRRITSSDPTPVMRDLMRHDLTQSIPMHLSVTPSWYRDMCRRMSQKSPALAGWAVVYHFLSQLENPTLSRFSFADATYMCPVDRFLKARRIEAKMQGSLQHARNRALKPLVKVSDFYTASKWFSVLLHELMTTGVIDTAVAHWINTADVSLDTSAEFGRKVCIDSLAHDIPNLGVGKIVSTAGRQVVIPTHPIPGDIEECRSLLCGDAWAYDVRIAGKLVFGSRRHIHTTKGPLTCMSGMVQLDR